MGRVCGHWIRQIIMQLLWLERTAVEIVSHQPRQQMEMRKGEINGLFQLYRHPIDLLLPTRHQLGRQQLVRQPHGRMRIISQTERIKVPVAMQWMDRLGTIRTCVAHTVSSQRKSMCLNPQSKLNEFVLIFYSFVRRLITKKEGPNKGRPFYVCPKQPQCESKFFQWADVPATNTHHNTSYGASSSSSSSSAPTNSSYSSRAGTSRGGYSSSAASDNSAGQARAKRKCSICKEEGHTRLKCPRLPNP